MRFHDALLRALELSGRADPAWLHTLAMGGDQPEAAMRHGLVTAEHATSALAFEWAAELYVRCLKLHCEESGETKRRPG